MNGFGVFRTCFVASEKACVLLGDRDYLDPRLTPLVYDVTTPPISTGL